VAQLGDDFAHEISIGFVGKWRRLQQVRIAAYP
jgi:hypothetical protein